MILSKEGTARRLTEAQKELILARWLNKVECRVLEAITEGINLCNIEDLPEWVANNVKISHPDWEVSYNTDYTQICWMSL